MKTKNVINDMKIFINIFIFLFFTAIYSQEGAYVDKDYRIKIYQKEMIKVLIDKQWFKKEEKGEIIVKNYSGSMGVTKCIEVFPIKPEKNKILLVRFYSLGTHSLNYWGFLETDSKFFFYYDDKSVPKIEEYLKKYDEKTRKILLDYVKIFKEWNKEE
ncbi:hypothetical protein FPG87_13060 [Flavobacterium psychrophilum]|nr:hypothetical protein SU65_12050 [Flavobacterium psychrophilum]OJH12234.1 hypothetical protein FPG87_13060 [Flavobacterium psychrophilum]